MTGQPISPQRVERNRAKVYACINHSILMFISISDKKIILLTVLLDKKFKIRAILNKTKVYAFIKHAVFMFYSISVNKKNSSYNSFG